MLTGFARSIEVLLWYRVLVGVGEASYATVSPSLISDLYKGERRNTALTIFYVAIPVGAGLGKHPRGTDGGALLMRNAFVWAGAPGLLLALVLLPFQDPPRGEAEGAGASGRGKPTPKTS